jgi:hypothetical protein
MASHRIYQFYSELQDYQPRIWRRFQVSGNISIAKLGYIIMTMYEMRASHLFSVVCTFDYHGKKKETYYEVPMDEAEPFDLGGNIVRKDATQVKLMRISNSPQKDLFHVNYDFGDDWWVDIDLEQIFVDDDLPGNELPRVLEGEGFGIIEDCGGVGGLEDLARAFKEKEGESYDQYSEWLSVDDLDLSAFDIDDMNFRLKKLPRIFKQIYESGLEPTQKSIDLIERQYLMKKGAK